MPRPQRIVKLAPRIFGGKAEKMKKFRIQRNVPLEDPKRYPLGLFPMPVDISFGSTKVTRRGALRINSPRNITQSSNKVLTKRTMDLGGLSHCTPYSLLSAFITDNKEFDVTKFEEKFSYPVAFKHIRGSKGKGFKKISNVEELSIFMQGLNRAQINSYFIEEYFPLTTEFRIHVSSWLLGVLMTYQYESYNKSTKQVTAKGPNMRSTGCILMQQKKRKTSSTQENRNVGTDVFMSTNFSHQPWMDNAIEEAVRLCALLQLDFMAVDVGYNRNTNTYKIFESNTNVGMSGTAGSPVNNVCLQHYLQALPRIVFEKGIAVHPSIFNRLIHQACAE